MRHIYLSTTLLCALLLLNIKPAQAQANLPAGTRPIRQSDCLIEVPDGLNISCGWLVVPENYTLQEGATVQLPYIILHAKSTNPAPDPVLFTQGGPGYSSLEMVWWFANSQILEYLDVIILEQRGNRFAEPSLVCSEASSWEEKPGKTPCLDEIRAKGIDIRQYSTVNMARDIIALRQALGYERWNLFGTSFSTTLMLLVMELDGGATRSAILQSVKPPNETTFAHESDAPLRAIKQMLFACETDSACREAYPDLEEQLFSVIGKLNEEPVEVEVIESDSGMMMPLSIGGDEFIDWILLKYLYQPAFPPHGTAYMPLLISELYRGNYTPLKNAAQNYWDDMLGNPNWAWGLFLAVNCQQELPAAGSNRPDTDLAAMEKLDGFSRSTAQRDICTAWNLEPLPPSSTAYLNSDVPTLVLAGSFDPVTPPEWSRTTAEHLPNSTYVEFAGYGHEVTTDNPCASTLMVNFLDAPNEELDINCVGQSSIPSFVLPKQVFIAPGLVYSASDVSIGSPMGVPWIETAAIIAILGTVVLLAIFFVLGIVWLVGRRKREVKTDRILLLVCGLALLVIAASLTIPLLTTQLNQEYLGSNELLYALGPSRDFIPATVLAWLAPVTAVMFLILAVLTGWTWATRRGNMGIRLIATFTVLFTLVIIFLGVRWGLFTMLL